MHGRLETYKAASCLVSRISSISELNSLFKLQQPLVSALSKRAFLSIGPWLSNVFRVGQPKRDKDTIRLHQLDKLQALRWRLLLFVASCALERFLWSVFSCRLLQSLYLVYHQMQIWRAPHFNLSEDIRNFLLVKCPER